MGAQVELSAPDAPQRPSTGACHPGLLAPTAGVFLALLTQRAIGSSRVSSLPLDFRVLAGLSHPMHLHLHPAPQTHQGAPLLPLPAPVYRHAGEHPKGGEGLHTWPQTSEDGEAGLGERGARVQASAGSRSGQAAAAPHPCTGKARTGWGWAPIPNAQTPKRRSTRVVSWKPGRSRGRVLGLVRT